MFRRYIEIAGGAGEVEKIVSQNMFKLQSIGSGNCTLLRFITNRSFFVVETNGCVWRQDLCHKDGAKIECGRKHFEAIKVGDETAEYLTAITVDDMMKEVLNEEES